MVDASAEHMTCAHCEGTGTCKNGQNQTSCAVCRKHQQLTSAAIEDASGLVCSVCRGRGILEAMASRLRNRLVPCLALIIVCFVLLLVWDTHDKENFGEILAFSGTLIGSITGYYFGGKSGNV